MRNRSQKTAETLLLDPTKNKKKPASFQAKLKKKVFGTRSRFCAEAIAKPQPEKCRNVAVGTH